MKYFVFLIILFICLQCAFLPAAHGQTKSSSEVEVNLPSGTFVGSVGLPFDVPFRIKGSTAGSVKRVEMTYRVKPQAVKSWMKTSCEKCARKGQLKWNDATCQCGICERKAFEVMAGLDQHDLQDGAWSQKVTWSNFDDATKDQQFYLTCGPLYPNVPYEFIFRTFRSASLPDAGRLAMNKALYQDIKLFVDDKMRGSLSDLNTKLNDILTKSVSPSTGIVDKTGQPYRIDITEKNLSDLVREMVNYQDKIDNATDGINGQLSLFQLTSADGYGDLVREIGKIKASPSTLLNPAGQAVWQGPVDVANTDLKNVRFSEVATVVSDPGQDIREILQGRKKFDGSMLVSSDSYHLPSIELLNAFFRILRAGTLTNPRGADVLSNNSDAIILAQINLDLVSGHVKDLQALQAAKTKILDAFPDILADKLLYNAYIVSDQSNPDVTSEKNAYIGLDFGPVFLPNYNQVFMYEGVNFYFAPVNKDAPLSTIHGFWRNAAKRLSIHFGITQNLVTAENKRYQALIGNVGSLMLGGGIRFNRLMRINAGCLWFWEKDVNPVIDHRKLRAEAAISLTFDINVGKALGGVGTALGL